jgi:hypothetical protein
MLFYFLHSPAQQTLPLPSEEAAKRKSGMQSWVPWGPEQKRRNTLSLPKPAKKKER